MSTLDTNNPSKRLGPPQSKIVFSADERFAAGLTFARSQYTIVVWDLTYAAAKDVVIEEHTRKVTGSFDIPSSSSGACLDLTISPDGSTLAVFEIATDQETWASEANLRRGNFPCRFFKYDTTFTPAESKMAAGTGSKVIKEIEVKLAPELETFVGFGRLQNKVPGSRNLTLDQELVFVACDGLSIAVYDLYEFSSRRRISCLYVLSLEEISVKSTSIFIGVPVSRRDSCRMLMESMHDFLIFWSNSCGFSSVWNWRNGGLLSYLNTPSANFKTDYEPIGRNASFSKDGSIIVFSEPEFIVAFFTDSGLRLGFVKLDGVVEELHCMHDDQLLAVVDSSFKIFDIANLETCISVIPLTSSDGRENYLQYILLRSNLSTDEDGPCGKVCRLFACSTPTAEHPLYFLRLIPALDPNISTQTPEGPKLSLPMSSRDSEAWGYTFVLECNLSTGELFLRIFEYEGINGGGEGEEMEVFSQVFFDFYEPEVVVLGHNNRFAVRLDFGVCLWQLPSLRGGSFTLLSFEPSKHPLLALNESIEAIRNGQRSLMEDLKFAQRSLTEDIKAIESQLEALKDELHRLNTEDDDIGYPVLCNHGKILRLPMSKERCRPVITLDISQSCYFGNQEALNCIKFIPDMLEVFVDGDALLTATRDYLMRHISRYLDQSDSLNNSVIGALVMHCEANSCEYFVREILDDPRRSWVPHASLFSSVDSNKDIFGILSKHSQWAMMRALAEYMLESARTGNRIEEGGNSGYLDLLLAGLPQIAKGDPSMALWITRQAVFLPTDYFQGILMQDAVLNNPPWRYSPLWKRVSAWLGGGGRSFNNELHEYGNPIFQVQSQLPLTVGGLRFSAVETRSFPKAKERNRLNAQIKLKFYMVPVSLAFSVQTTLYGSSDLPPPNSIDTSFYQWIGLWSEFLLRSFQLGYARRVVEHTLPLQAYDSLALQAIIDFKWNRIARTFWIIRFTFQAVYYVLVLSVSFSQLDFASGDYSNDGQFVYNSLGTSLRGEFIAIFAVGLFFFYLELKQACWKWRRYLTIYNILDFSVYLLLTIVSAIQLASPMEANSNRLLSFTIVFLYIHFIFELRVYKNVCQVVVIIISIMVQVPSFFFILAVFVLAFAHSLLHLSQTNYQSFCPTPTNGIYPEACINATPTFPNQYFDAVTTTYFFIVGNYDAVTDSMGQGHPLMQIMVALFVFTTVILMLNVVIALMNAAYSVGASEGLLVWMSNRVEVVARIENLSYFIPNHRLKRDHYPRYVFYTATEDQVRSFAEKYDRPELLETLTRTKIAESSAADMEAVEVTRAVAKEVQSLKQMVEEMKTERVRDNKMIVEMLREMRQSTIPNSAVAKEELLID